MEAEGNDFSANKILNEKNFKKIYPENAGGKKK